MAKLKPGFVWGDDYKTLVDEAKKGGYAIPAVNVTSTSTINAVLEAAAKAGSDVIIQCSNGGAQFLAGASLPGTDASKVLGAISMAKHIHNVASAYGICVAIHTDHCNKSLLGWVDGLVTASEEHFKATGTPLFSSHMLDLSEEPIAENLETSAKFLKRMAPMGMSLEIELGMTGGEEDGIGSEFDETADHSHLYTKPEDVLKAYDKLNPIGHVAVAASFGNVHGVYKPGNVVLNPEILKDSQAFVSKERGTDSQPMNFVFHGGSGSEQEKIESAVSYGVFKMNIDTDTQFAYAEPIGVYVNANPKAFLYQVDPETDAPYKSKYDPRKWIRSAEQGIVDRLQQAFKDLNGVGRSLAK